MKRPLLLVALLCVFGAAKAQPYGNEWIDYGKQYWKLKLFAPNAFESIWRIDSTTLANSGFPLGTVNPQDIQLFGREKEVPIWVEGEADSVFNSTDFIEFHARNNDAWMDAAHWENPGDLNTRYYNMYNDTIYYYLTIANSTEVPKRIQPYQNTDFGGLPLRTWCWGENIIFTHIINSGYQKGEVDYVGAQSSFMGPGEGWVARLQNDILNGTPATYNLPCTLGVVYQGPGAPDGELTTVTMGENDPCDNAATPVHHSQLAFGPIGSQTVIFDSTLSAFQNVHHTIAIPASLIVPGSNISLIAQDDAAPCTTSVVTNYVTAWSDIKLLYPRTFDNGGAQIIKAIFDDDPQELDANVQFTNVYGVPIFHVLNDDTTWRVMPTNAGGTSWNARFPANGAGDRSTVFGLYGINGWVSAVTSITPVTPSGFFTDHAVAPLDSACIIITHGTLMNAVTLLPIQVPSPISTLG